MSNLKDIVLIGDARIFAIPTVECGEAFGDFHAEPTVIVDDSRVFITSDSPHFAKARLTLIKKISTASKSLPDGLRIKIVEAYRPLAIQQAEFSGYRDRLRTAHPDWNDHQLQLETSRYLAPPEVAAHPTGAAIDLTLCNASGEDMDMGSSINLSSIDGSTLTYTASTDIPPQARELRNLLSRAMQSQGLVNYPSEWWHWSFGDKYWAFCTGNSTARYAAKDVHEL